MNTTPLIDDTHLYRLPETMKELPSDTASLLELGLVSKDYTYHWHKGGYRPYGEDKPYRKQQEFHEAEYRHRLFIAGLGAGKTMAGAAEVVKQVITQPGLVVIVAAPTYPILNESTMPVLTQLLHPWAIAYRNKVEGVLELVNNSKVIIRSTEKPKSIRGISAGGIWYDEGSHGDEMGWKVLIGRLRQPRMQRFAIVTSTPNGMDWTFDYFGDPSRGDKSKRNYWYINSSSRENPFLPKDYIESLESSYTGAFATQEIEGKWTTFAGLVYDNFNRDIHVRDIKTMLASEELVPKEVWYGHDWGYKDPMVITVLLLDEDGRLWQVDEWYKPKQIMQQVINQREKFEKTYGEGTAVADASRPEFIKELNVAGFLTMPTVNKDIMEGIANFRARLVVQDDARPRFFVDRSCIHTIKEMYRYQYKEEDEKKAVKDKPIKKFDHAADANRYVAWEIDRVAGLGMMDNADLDEVFG